MLLSALSLSCASCTGKIAGADDDTGGDDDGNQPPLDPNLQVQLVPAAGQSGTQVVNFAVPLQKGMATSPDVRVASAGTNLATYRRGLGAYDDGSLRAIQIQVELEISGSTTLDLEIGATGGGDRAAVDVATTLVTADGTDGPRVWALLPPAWLAGSGVIGRLVPAAEMAGTPLDAFGDVCDYERWNTEMFLAQQASRDVWLFDRVTAMYRGYAITGDAAPLASAYREAAIYRAGLTGSGSSTRIGVPGAADDLKYHYTQGMALHWLLTGDDRFREAAENVAVRTHALWTDPGYAGGADFWTERHAGFALLAYEWAAAVSDDQAATFRGWADEAVDAYLDMQTSWPTSWTDPEARCFAHTADAHGEGYGYAGCSPWMSAILADGLETHAERHGGARAATVREALVRLGRIIARDGRDGDGKPYYWMGLGRAGEVDDYEEHWGESAYIVAMAWHHGGRTDAALRTAADELLTGLRERGEAGQLRSFNWQCRSAVQAPAYLR
ncbi:MAG: hypothetical protein K8M05_06995 [Deltaproteobacteria bacterium]|nr:hypothetical protein [Kofleriaceae bacterium]